MKRTLLLGGAAGAALLALLAAFVAPRALGCPSPGTLRTYRPPEASRVYAADGSIVAELSPARRVAVELGEIPAVLRDGFVAVEDRRFFRHRGIDVRGIGRAAAHDLAHLSLREGFSTITMQLARQLFPDELPMSARFRRKTCELAMAVSIEREFPKRQILNLYLNQIYLGNGLYGVERAAEGYFGKPARELTLPEAALLIGLNKNPEGYNPRKHLARAVERRNTVLDVLAREGVIGEVAASRARLAPLRLAAPPEAAGPAPYFVAGIRHELRERFGPEADVSGLRVYTGLDPALQRAARRALVDQIASIEAGRYGRYRHPVMPPDADPDPSADGSPYLQGLVVALDPATGAVRALVGGRDFTHSQFDRVYEARRQPGSAFKPIVYETAIESGLTATTRIETTPVALAGAGSAPWRPDDEVPDSVTSLSARDALARSSNFAAVRVGESVGTTRVIDTARALGLTTPIPAYPAIFLGAAEVRPIELVAAYAAFGNGGWRVAPHLIERVEDKHGRVLWRAAPPRARALDEGAAFITLGLLRDVVDRGTGTAVRQQGFWLPAAGKTGTTNAGRDTWFIGMTPDLVAGVWLGFDRPRPIVAGGSGGRLAAPVWGRMMREAYRTRPNPAPWLPPTDLVALPVDTTSGLLATSHCPANVVRVEYYLPGTEPRESCHLHHAGSLPGRIWKGIRKAF